jgi:membrane protease YdiL (CAAX protease family)
MVLPPEDIEGGNKPSDAGAGVRSTAEPAGRYTIQIKNGTRELVCHESPSIAVYVERGMSVAAQAVRKSAPGTIYLDGVAQTGPMMDVEKHIYNLDHHQGCIRSFTLATCEQAMVVVRKGLGLQERDWKVYANEPDFDTVLAIWILLNHLHVNDGDGEVRSRIMPLVRLQGVIDAQGLEMQELCGFPEELRDATYGKLLQLRERELELKKEGRWQEIDFLEYTAEALRTVDAIVYSTHHFEAVLKVDELARREMEGRSLAIACRCDAGIYEVEQYLKRVHGKRLGIIILQKDEHNYTLRQVDSFLSKSLVNIYERLNTVDPAVRSTRSGNCWSGSAEIGGSPRATGTGLTPGQISEICAEIVQAPKTVRRLRRVVFSLASATAAIVLPILAVYLLGRISGEEISLREEIFGRIGVFAFILCLSCVFLSWVGLRRFPRLYGLSLPFGWDWILLFPFALLSGVYGGIWVYDSLPPDGPLALISQSWNWILIALALPLSVEILFRGFLHGAITYEFRIKPSGGRWRFSPAIMISALLYTLLSCIPYLPLRISYSPLAIAALLIFGLTAGMARERSESLLPPLLFHWASLILLISGVGPLPLWGTR